MQQLINDIKAMPAYTPAMESSEADQKTPLRMLTYDTVIFYRSRSYSAAAAAFIYQYGNSAKTLFYSVGDIRYEPNLAAIITRNTDVVFINVIYSGEITAILTAFAKSVVHVRKTSRGLLADLSVGVPLPWWVPFHAAMERKEFDDTLVLQYTSYISKYGPPTVQTFRSLTNLAPHAFFELAAPKYKSDCYINDLVCAGAYRAYFFGYHVYVIPDGVWRHPVCFRLFKQPDCDFVLLFAPRGNQIVVFMRGDPNILEKKQINLAVIAKQLGGGGGGMPLCVGSFCCSNIANIIVPRDTQ